MSRRDCEPLPPTPDAVAKLSESKNSDMLEEPAGVAIAEQMRQECAGGCTRSSRRCSSEAAFTSPVPMLHLRVV